jgi:hypothetical protein
MIDFGHKNLDKIADIAIAMQGIALRAYFDPSKRAGAKLILKLFNEEITELLKALPE